MIKKIKKFFSCSDEEFVKLLYKEMFNRPPDIVGYEFYVVNLKERGLSRLRVLSFLLTSDEYKRSVSKRQSYVLFGNILVKLLIIFDKTTPEFCSVNAGYLYFLHIPKTAGTTLINTLDKFFKPEEIYFWQTWNSIPDGGYDDIFKHRFVRGHFGASLFKGISDVKTITVLRNPSERALSLYYHMTKDKVGNNWVPNDFLDGINSFDELVMNSGKSLVVSNGQVRHIAQMENINEYIQNDLKGNYSQYRMESDSHFLLPQPSYPELLRIAKSEILKYTFIGIQEEFDKTLMLLSFTFGLEPIENDSRLMVWDGKPSLESFDLNVRKRLEELNRYDYELYMYAKEIFEMRYNSMVRTLKKFYPLDRVEGMDENSIVMSMLAKRAAYIKNLEKLFKS